MWEQEKHHLKEFEKLIPKYRVRPTILLPLWNIAGLVSLFVVLLLAKFDYFACLPQVSLQEQERPYWEKKRLWLVLQLQKTLYLIITIGIAYEKKLNLGLRLIIFNIKSQLRDLLEKHPEKHVELLEIIQKFRDDEMDHHDTGLKMGAEQV